MSGQSALQLSQFRHRPRLTQRAGKIMSAIANSGYDPGTRTHAALCSAFENMPPASHGMIVADAASDPLTLQLINGAENKVDRLI